jgi:hypothetical protein
MASSTEAELSRQIGTDTLTPEEEEEVMNIASTSNRECTSIQRSDLAAGPPRFLIVKAHKHVKHLRPTTPNRSV